MDPNPGRESSSGRQQTDYEAHRMEGSMERDDDDDEGTEHARPRKRTRRACDKCSSSRTRCDGE
jgi:hypothetical protein